LAAAVAIADRADYRMLNVTDPDQFTIDYHESMRAVVGSERIGEWSRLFLAPGMGHFVRHSAHS
jgi:hypothetical protein